jgi:branched-subunit amino acid transport protein
VSTSTGWVVILLSGLGCYALKLTGYAVPERWFGRPRLRAALELLPVTLLAALIVVQALASGRHYDLDGPRLAGLGVAAAALWFRASFIVVVVTAAATAALMRLA